MEIIDKTASNKKEYSLGDIFKLVTTRTDSLVDVLMICQDINVLRRRINVLTMWLKHDSMYL